MKYIYINLRNGTGREMGKFWNDANECLRKFKKERRVVLIGDRNGWKM